MAKKSSVERNNKRKKMVRSLHEKRQALHNKIYDKSIDLEERFSLIMQLSKLPRNSAKNRIRNRCAMTGRPRGFSRKMGISRNVLRELASSGFLPGVVKASW